MSGAVLEKSREAALDALDHGVILCRRDGLVTFANRAARSEIPALRVGSLFGRICPAVLCDDKVELAPVMGKNRFILCRAIHGGLFRVDLPGGAVADSGTGAILRRLWMRSREEGDPGAASIPDRASFALVEALQKCFDDLRGDGVPGGTVSLAQLLSALKRRIRLPLESVGASLEIDCPPDILCRAELRSPVFTVLNVIVFMVVCASQKRIVAAVREDRDVALLTFEACDGGRAAAYLKDLFPLDENSPYLSMAPLILAFHGAVECGGRLSCRHLGEVTRLELSLPLMKGRADLVVMDPEGAVPAQLEDSLGEFFDACKKILNF